VLEMSNASFGDLPEEHNHSERIRMKPPTEPDCRLFSSTKIFKKF
jgi:hypothetical protein